MARAIGESTQVTEGQAAGYGGVRRNCIEDYIFLFFFFFFVMSLSTLVVLAIVDLSLCHITKHILLSNLYLYTLNTQ